MNTSMRGRKTVAGWADDGGGRRRSLWKGPALITALILLIPLLRDLFVNGWNWDLRGFLLVGAVGAVLFGTGVAFLVITRNLGTIAYRAAVGVALVAAFLLVWVNLVQAADDVNRAAVMYFAVPIVGIIAAAMARLQPNGMARALFATALAQALVLAIALIIRNPQVSSSPSGLSRGFGANAFFAMLFVGSALLFRKAALGKSAPGAV
jgi:hypothetical protein